MFTLLVCLIHGGTAGGRLSNYSYANQHMTHRQRERWQRRLALLFKPSSVLPWTCRSKGRAGWRGWGGHRETVVWGISGEALFEQSVSFLLWSDSNRYNKMPDSYRVRHKWPPRHQTQHLIDPVWLCLFLSRVSCSFVGELEDLLCCLYLPHHHHPPTSSSKLSTSLKSNYLKSNCCRTVAAIIWVSGADRYTNHPAAHQPDCLQRSSLLLYVAPPQPPTSPQKKPLQGD